MGMQISWVPQAFRNGWRQRGPPPLWSAAVPYPDLLMWPVGYCNSPRCEEPQAANAVACAMGLGIACNCLAILSIEARPPALQPLLGRLRPVRSGRAGLRNRMKFSSRRSRLGQGNPPVVLLLSLRASYHQRACTNEQDGQNRQHFLAEGVVRPMQPIKFEETEVRVTRIEPAAVFKDVDVKDVMLPLFGIEPAEPAIQDL